MKTFTVYEQRAARGDGLTFSANLVEVGLVRAVDSAAAIEAARALTKWPVVQEVRK